MLRASPLLEHAACLSNGPSVSLTYAGMPNFFHVADPGLRVGEIIQPGKWGRETLAFAQRGRRGIQQDSDAINLIWEAALEAARIVRFPEATSRLDCVFACFREEDARAFRDRFRPDHKIYGVELINPATPVTIGDYGAITDAEPGPYVEMAAQIAATYWNALKPRFPEALIGGPVRVTSIAE